MLFLEKSPISVLHVFSFTLLPSIKVCFRTYKNPYIPCNSYLKSKLSKKTSVNAVVN